MQFDVETGSLLSGVYEVEQSPSILESPLGPLPMHLMTRIFKLTLHIGVDIIRPPASFNYSYPGVMHDLERHGFGAAWRDRRQRGNIQQSVASTPEVFTSVRVRDLDVMGLG